MCYEECWAGLNSSSEPIAFSDIPWPLASPPLNSKQILLTDQGISVLSPSFTKSVMQGANSSWWHLDKFSRILRRVRDEDKVAVVELLKLTIVNRIQWLRSSRYVFRHTPLSDGSDPWHSVILVILCVSFLLFQVCQWLLQVRHTFIALFIKLYKSNSYSQSLILHVTSGMILNPILNLIPTGFFDVTSPHRIRSNWNWVVEVTTWVTSLNSDDSANSNDSIMLSWISPQDQLRINCWNSNMKALTSWIKGFTKQVDGNIVNRHIISNQEV